MFKTHPEPTLLPTFQFLTQNFQPFSYPSPMNEKPNQKHAIQSTSSALYCRLIGAALSVTSDIYNQEQNLSNEFNLSAS